MDEKATGSDGASALMVVLRDYVSYGDPGIADLKEQVAARRRKPVIDAFCEELRAILAKQAPVPTEQINAEFALRAEEADVEPMQVDDQEAYEALAELWEHLELQLHGDAPEDNPGAAIGPPRAADRARAARPRFLWVDDPMDALRAWMSWKFLGLFVGGAAVAIASWSLRSVLHISALRGVLQLLTILGCGAAAYGGSMLWLRRVRYVDPDAYLPSSRKALERRRR